MMDGSLDFDARWLFGRDDVAERLVVFIEQQPRVAGVGFHQTTAGTFDFAIRVACTRLVEPHELRGGLAMVLKQERDALAACFRVGRLGADHGAEFQLGDEGIDARLAFMDRNDLLWLEQTHLREPLSVLRLAGEVRPFVGIGLDVVEFLAVVAVVDVAPAFGAEGVVAGIVEMRERGMRPCGGGIAQQRDEAAAFDVGLRGQAAELGERGVEIDETHGPQAHGARLRAFGQTGGTAWHPHHERHAGAGTPAGEFLPVLLLAKMPSVIAPEHDDGVVAMRARFERIEHATQHRIREMNRREIGLNALLPLPMCLNVGEVAIATEFLAQRRHIIEIALLDAGAGSDRFERKRLKIFLRHIRCYFNQV